MKADFTIREMELNSIMAGRILWIENNEGVEEQKIISYVKVVPKSPIILVTFTDEQTIEINEHKCYTFEVNNKLKWKKATRKQLKDSEKNL